MFTGHYAAAFAGRAAGPVVPLWVLFVAVQFLDYLWPVFILLGVEQARIVPGFLEGSNLDLHFMPYSHGLVSAVVWSVVFAAGYRVLARPAKPLLAMAITGGAVFSHWLADFLVHIEDLPLLFGEPKVGLGLWRSLLWSQVVEVSLLVLGMFWFLRRTEPKGVLGKVTPWLLLVVLLGAQMVSQLPPDPVPSIESFAVQALIAFTLIAAVAALVDHSRRLRS